MLSVLEQQANTSMNCSHSAAVLPVIHNFRLKFQTFSYVGNKLNGKKIKFKGLSYLNRDSFTLSKQHIFHTFKKFNRNKTKERGVVLPTKPQVSFKLLGGIYFNVTGIVALSL